MAKPKSPLLSFGATGTIADSLTFQKRNHGTIARTKPIPKDPYTLAQAYQRWDYQDYAYLWTLQSQAVQQTYRTRASRYHITGFSLWMREHLRDLPDLAGRWHLDEKAGAIAYDSSKYATNGIIFGATPTTGLIDGAQYFTLNDYIEITAPQLNFTSEDFSLVATIKVDSLPGLQSLFRRGLINFDGWEFFIYGNGRIYVYTSQSGERQYSHSPNGSIVINTWYTVGFSRAGASITLYKNGLDVTLRPGFHVDPLTSTRTAKIGIDDNLTDYPFDGRIDNLIVYNRALDATEHKRHSDRRYPA
ncbi:hypothetical protein ES708_34714 [subsurface metagenome]